MVTPLFQLILTLSTLQAMANKSILLLLMMPRPFSICRLQPTTAGPQSLDIPLATDAIRAMIGGYTMSITSCLKHAVDGYSFWGANVMAKVGKDWANTTFGTAFASLAVT